MKQDNKNFNIEQFLIIFLSFLCEYECYEIDIDDFKSYIKLCITNNEYNQIFKCFENININKSIDVMVSKFTDERILKKINGNIYEITDDISNLDICYNNISGFLQKLIDFVDNYYEKYLNKEKTEEDYFVFCEKIRCI